jgi:hypothetical protein
VQSGQCAVICGLGTSAAFFVHRGDRRQSTDNDDMFQVVAVAASGLTIRMTRTDGEAANGNDEHQVLGQLGVNKEAMTDETYHGGHREVDREC